MYVSDITYWRIETGFIYISLITDAYSHKIVGYFVSETLEAYGSIQALKMAIENNEVNENTIHHSDRGVQYCCAKYITILNNNNYEISMTESVDSRDNALAELINGIIKNEYLYNYTINNIKEAKELLETVVKLYNEDRPHMSIGNFTPKEAIRMKNYNLKENGKTIIQKILHIPTFKRAH